MDRTDLLLRNLAPRYDAVAVACLRGYFAARQVAIHDTVDTLGKEACRNVEAAAIRHVRVHQVRDGHRDVRFGTESLDQHLASTPVLPVQKGSTHATASPMRMDIGTHDGSCSFVDPAQHTHRCNRANIPIRIKADNRIHPIAAILPLHHVSDVFHRGASNSVIVVFDQGDECVHGGRVAANHGPPAQPEVIARVRDGPGRRESLRKSCHAYHPSG